MGPFGKQDDITIREAVGNTVRNVTGQWKPAGIRCKRNPSNVSLCMPCFSKFFKESLSQEMGGGVKVSFSSSDEEYRSFIHARSLAL